MEMEIEMDTEMGMEMEMGIGALWSNSQLNETRCIWLCLSVC
jgi:hypothetical protein